MSSRTGKKRAATLNGGESSTSNAPASKKTRFVEPEDDPVNFAEQVDSALETAPRRGKVKNEGYESDSSDDGEGVVPSRKKGGADKEEDEDDMFATEEKEEEAEGKKSDKYMRLGDIEGQEFNNNSDDEDSDNPNLEDKDAVERKKKKEMGYELSSFNMREEMEEGKFTEDGSYVRTVDPLAIHDRWMDGLSEREIKLTRKRHREQEKQQREKMEREEKELEESGGQIGIEMRLLPMLKKGETILEALQRLGAQAKRKQPATKPKKRKANPDSMNVDNSPKAPTDIEILTELASSLLSFGDAEIYSKTYEEIVRHIRSSANVEPNWQPPSADIKYEYKWNAPGTEQASETFGPFSEDDMKAWYKAVYFGSYGEKVKVRRVGGEWGDWDDVIH